MFKEIAQSFQSDWQAWSIGVAVTIIVAIVLRMAEKQKWAEKLRIAGEKCGIALSIILLRWLPPSVAEKAEEGIIVTALHIAKSFLEGLEIGILLDNKKRLDKREADK
jgi:hypothetical protein